MPILTNSGVVAEHVIAVNAHDLDRIVATFAPDAYVNDNRREIWGTEAIRAFMAKEFVGDDVTMEVREVLDHYGDVIVRARYDGTYDKTNLPDELVMTSYFGICDDKIASLTIIFNQPSPYYPRHDPFCGAGVGRPTRRSTQARGVPSFKGTPTAKRRYLSGAAPGRLRMT